MKLRRARQKMSELFPLTEGTEHPLLSTGEASPVQDASVVKITHSGQFSAPSVRECDPEPSQTPAKSDISQAGSKENSLLVEVVVLGVGVSLFTHNTEAMEIWQRLLCQWDFILGKGW